MEISFGYKSPIKKIAKYGAYTGKKFTEELKPTFEHILPHSEGGSASITNGLATIASANNARGNMRFDKWLEKTPSVIKNIQKYLNRMREVKINGINYVEAVKKTLNREARGVAAFRGNKLDRKA